jgi:hypothetical protein
MIRKFLLASTTALLLSGCATTGVLGPITVANVQTLTISVCSFLPTAGTIENILLANVPGLTTAQAIAQAICNALVPAKSSRRGAAAPNVAGVPIHGRFVR